ncbi:hypothetical protein Gotur_030784, partial [Gossypium turneri]
KLVNNSKFERIGHRAELPGLEFFTSKGLVASKSSTTAFNKIMKALKDAEINKIGELWSRLKEGKFIIILDDLWNEWNDDEDFRKIGIPLVENGKGCKIILTTRRWTVCKSMECPVTIQIDVLDDDEAWALFKMNANLDENVSRNIIEEAEKFSRLMEIGNIEEEEKNAYMCIKMSYEYLKKEVTKRCFLLCALYPEDHSIDVEDLVRYAWALELYGKVDSVEEVRIQVLEAIDYLKDSCLLLKDTQWYDPLSRA